MQKDRLRFLQETPVFGGVGESSLEHLLKHAECIQISKGTMLFKEGDLDNSIYVLEKGRVAIYRSWQGRYYKLQELAEGDCLGEMALIDCKPRSATVVALEPCHAIRVSVAQMGELYTINPAHHALIYMNLAREVCRRLRAADQRHLIYLAENNNVESANAGLDWC